MSSGVSFRRPVVQSAVFGSRQGVRKMSLYPTVRTTIRMMPMVYWKKFDAVVPFAPYLCIRQSRETEDNLYQCSVDKWRIITKHIH